MVSTYKKNMYIEYKEMYVKPVYAYRCSTQCKHESGRERNRQERTGNFFK